MFGANAFGWPYFAQAYAGVSSTAYTLDADPGSVTVTGDSAELLAARVLPASPGSYAATGDAAQLLASRLLNAAAAVYAITGDSAALLAARILNVAAASYAIIGDAADLVQASTGAYVLLAAAGSIQITGSDTGFTAPARGGGSVGRGDVVDVRPVILRNDDEIIALVASLL